MMTTRKNWKNMKNLFYASDTLLRLQKDCVDKADLVQCGFARWKSGVDRTDES